MNKNEDDKLVNAIIALHQEIKGLRQEFVKEIKELRSDMEKHQAKTNLALGEMRLSYMRVADELGKLRSDLNGLRSDLNGLRSDFNNLRSDFNKYALRNDERADNHQTRIVRLEEKTFGSSFVSEPKAIYKKRKTR